MQSLNKKRHCCKNCGHVVAYKNGKLECMKEVVSPYGLCDRFQPQMTPTAITRIIDRKLKELDQYENGQFRLTQRPAFHQNYHLITEGISK